MEKGGGSRGGRGLGKADYVRLTPSEVATKADEEGAFTWAPASGAERVEVDEQETAGGLGEGRDEVMG